MRHKKNLRVMAIEATSPDDFNRQINEVLGNAEDAEIVFDSGWLRAYVRYYEMREEYYYCGGCLYYTDRPTAAESTGLANSEKP